MGSCLQRATAALVLMLGAHSVSAACLGDCDGDGRVTVSELVAGVDIALGGRGAEACPDYGCAEPGCVVIQMLVSAVEHALNGCPGATPTPTVTPTPDALVSALDAAVPCSFVGRGVTVTDNGYNVHCIQAPGHATEVGLSRHANAADAAAAFASAGAPGEAADFHGFEAMYWEIPFYDPFLGGAHRFLVWQLGCWVIFVHSFDDTTYRIAPQPLPVSEAILETAGDLLLEQCPDASM